MVVFVNAIPLISPLPLAPIPVTSVVLFRVHAKVVLAILLLVLKAIVVNEVPEHIV